MKKRFMICIASLISILHLSTQVSFAKEEVGVFKAAWRKFLNLTRGTSQEERERPKPKPIFEAQPKPETVSEAQPAPKPKPEIPPEADLSEDELRERISHTLEIVPEIADYLPGLRFSGDADGNILNVEYSIDGVYKDIETLDKDTLAALYRRINNERTRIQSERIARQLSAVKSAPDIPKLPPDYRPPDIPTVPTQPPSVPKAPPQPPPSPPKTPAPPPQPPRR